MVGNARHRYKGERRTRLTESDLEAVRGTLADAIRAVQVEHADTTTASLSALSLLESTYTLTQHLRSERECSSCARSR